MNDVCFPKRPDSGFRRNDVKCQQNLMTLPLNKPVDREARSTMRQLAPDTHYLKSNVTELWPHKVSQRNLAMKLETAGQRRRQDPPQRIGELDLYVRRSSGLRLIDTRCGSRKGHYVTPISQAFRPQTHIVRLNCGPNEIAAKVIERAYMHTHHIAGVSHPARTRSRAPPLPNCRSAGHPGNRGRNARDPIPRLPSPLRMHNAHRPEP